MQSEDGSQFFSGNVQRVQLEVTDKCNARCPMCPRTINGGPINPNIRNEELSLEQTKKILTPEFLRQLKQVILCGNHGDPMVASESLEILEYFRTENPKISLGFHTNASGRTAEWWQRLGRILNQKYDYCAFGIDGLEDTNSIYRKQTSWKKIMLAAENFIEAGGNARWEFLVFRHNEHQIEEAKALSKEMGFQKFVVKKTSRFYDDNHGNQDFPVFDKNGDTIEYLYPPSKSQLVNPVTKKLEEKIQAGESPSASNSSSTPEIECFSIKDESIYISVLGEVYPCCFLGGVKDAGEGEDERNRLRDLASSPGREWNLTSAYTQSINEIVDGQFFSRIRTSWDIQDESESCYLGTCKQICSKNQSVYLGEKENR